MNEQIYFTKRTDLGASMEYKEQGKTVTIMQYRTVIGAICIAVLGVVPVGAGPASAATSATTAGTQYPCGYDGYQDNGQPFYNHCGKTDIVIQVDHIFWQTTYDCVKPGVHRIDQGNSQWAIIGAEYDGHVCTFPGPVIGPNTAAPVGASVMTVTVVRPAPYPLQCRVTASNVNYRRGPGKQYASLGQVNRGFRFASDGGVPNPHSRLQYWDNIRRPGHADGYIDDIYVFCWLP